MKAYQDLLEDILRNGKYKPDRTGTGTISVFGRQLRFDLQEGFPLLTTKKMFTRGVIGELLWFIEGNTNAYHLEDKYGVGFWKDWADGDGELGPLYGKQLRSIEFMYEVMPKTRIQTPDELYFEDKRNVFGVGVYGDYEKLEFTAMLKDVWRDMLRRCYYKKATGYKSYGAKGIHVHPDWFVFANFQRDVQKLTNWECKLEYGSEYSLDKDVKFAANYYSKDTCMWSSRKEQSYNTSTNRYFTAKSPAVVRVRVIDQLKELVAVVKHSPDSRRLLISLYNPHELDKMRLQPCHGNVIQFYVVDGRLSCQMYQRSADSFLGLPVNIASYALLTHMIAQQCDLEVGELIWTGGDVHIYVNHLDQVREQLRREPRPLPTLLLHKQDSIDDYVYEDVKLEGYDPHPAIKAPISV